MKKVILLISFSSIFFLNLQAQDIADVGVKSRFEKSKGIYFAGGLGLVQGALGDYSTGVSFETGFMKRLNKVMSIGAGISYLSFNYDKDKTYPYYYNPNTDEIIILSLKGGDVSLLSAGFNFKLSIIPVSDNTVFSIYGIATPFVSFYTRSEVTGNGDIYAYNATSDAYDDFQSSDTWTKDDGFPVLKQESKVTGGAYLGVGMELFPAKTISGFLQATYGYTLPITFVNTRSFLHDADIYNGDSTGRNYYGDDSTTKISYYNDQFPIVKKGFTALSIKLGISINF